MYLFVLFVQQMSGIGGCGQRKQAPLTVRVHGPHGLYASNHYPHTFWVKWTHSHAVYLSPTHPLVNKYVYMCGRNFVERKVVAKHSASHENTHIIRQTYLGRPIYSIQCHEHILSKQSLAYPLETPPQVQTMEQSTNTEDRLFGSRTHK